ncbi:hypothetical protein CFK37_09555 [Virgibacillus phasianinus]|uniref:Uncharacterized protein n=1 Tax=Virgibacillus phasianinus TaxID=2017483 RepID=A0A220U287_9BACI|nr:hypothetical protein [Virgibacillus phasianinus]ASK62384.1 hypothetical protein CFK37_09555 [Virgibacillus phasianinus]
MEQQVLDLLKKMNNRLDTIEAKLEGAVGSTSELTRDEMDFILYKVNKLEMELYLLKKRNSNFS